MRVGLGHWERGVWEGIREMEIWQNEMEIGVRMGSS